MADDEESQSAGFWGRLVSLDRHVSSLVIRIPIFCPDLYFLRIQVRKGGEFCHDEPTFSTHNLGYVMESVQG